MTGRGFEVGGEASPRTPRSTQDETRSTLPKTIPGWELQLSDAADLLERGGRAARAEAIRLLDSAVGLRAGSRGQRGVTISAAAGCRCLPAYLVRRVEYEGAMRRLNWSEMEIGRVHGLFADSWYYGDVVDADAAVEYLMRGTLSGNVFAKRVLDWLAPESGRGLSWRKDGGREEYLRAIREGERERAVELGRMVVAGVGLGEVRADATVLVRMGGAEQKALAANNIGYLLAHGKGGVERDVREAVEYYGMAMRWGSASAASNLGFLWHYGVEGVLRRDGRRARELYEEAVRRGERNYAPRNLGVLLHRGGKGVRADVCAAARWLLVGLREGDRAARVKCARSLRGVLRSWRMGVLAGGLRRECVLALQAAEGVGEAGVVEANKGDGPYGM